MGRIPRSVLAPGTEISVDWPGIVPEGLKCRLCRSDGLAVYRPGRCFGLTLMLLRTSCRLDYYNPCRKTNDRRSKIPSILRAGLRRRCRHQGKGHECCA